MASAPHVVFVHDDDPGFLARRMRSLGLPDSIDVVVPDLLAEEYFRHWRTVYPQARKDDYLYSAVRLWRVSHFKVSRRRRDVLVCEEMQDWPAASLPNGRGRLERLARVVIVGCAGINTRVRALLPHLRRWDFDERLLVCRRAAPQIIESKLSAPECPLQSSQYVPWTVELADRLPRMLQRKEEPEFAVFWSAFASARAFVELKLREDSAAEARSRALKCLAAWTCRAALLAFCACSSRTKEQVRSKAAGLRAFLGADLALVCPECLAPGPHSPCDWDLRTQPSQGAAALLEMDARRLSSFVARFTAARALFAQKVLRAAQASGAGAPREARRLEVGLLLLRSWENCRMSTADMMSTADIDAFEGLFRPPFTDPRGVSLHLGTAVWTCYGMLGAPVVEGRALERRLFTAQKLADRLAVRTFLAHLARAGLLAKCAARVAARLLADFLAVNWCVLAGHSALLRHGFHNEIAEVHIYPSFFLGGEDLRLLRSRIPRAKIVWHARAESPTALAMSAIFG
jgi:hypothetical protein